MKTTIDLPDPIFRRAKATAAVQGITLKTYISKAIEQSLNSEQQDWRTVLNNLPHVEKETTKQIMDSVAAWDETDLEFQRQQLEADK